MLQHVHRKKCESVLAQHDGTQTCCSGECPAAETLPGLCSRQQARSRPATQVLSHFLLDFFLSSVTEAIKTPFNQLFGQYLFRYTKVFDVYISLVNVSHKSLFGKIHINLTV